MLFKLESIPYWPNYDPASGEPDEYADGIVNREWGLYVDWVDFDGRWFLPNSSTLAYYYAQEQVDGKRVGEDRIGRILSPLEKANSEGLFRPEALKIVHTIMPNVFVTTQTSEVEIIHALEEIGRRLAEARFPLSNETLASTFMCYPLYAVLLTPEKVKGYWEP
jgi:hypothetical protein